MPNLTTGVPEKNIIFPIFGFQKKDESIKTCDEYLNNKNLTPKLKDFLKSIKIILKSTNKNFTEKIDELFNKFYTKYLEDSSIKRIDFKKLFINISYFNKVNNYLIKKIFNEANNKFKGTLLNKIGNDINKSKLGDFINLRKSSDRVILSEFIKEVRKLDSDYYPGVYSLSYNKEFSGLPTRVYYGLCLQWDEDRINWKETYGHSYKQSTITNKEKFEYLINHQEKLQEKLQEIAKRLNNCNVSDIVNLFKNIINVDISSQYDWLILYYLRAYYLFDFLKRHDANIRTDLYDNPFMKKIHVKNPNTGRYVQSETEGTFLSIFYDIYFDETKPKRQSRISTKSRDRSSSPTGVDNNLSKSSSNSVSGIFNNNKSINSNNVKPNSKFNPNSPTYNTNFPNTLLTKKTTKKIKSNQ